MEQEKAPFYKKSWFVVVTVLLGTVFVWSMFDTSPKQSSAQPAANAEKQNTISKEDAQKEFTRLMDLSKQSGLVKSHEMSDDVSLKIYVGDVWYTQDVQFKKDMVAKFSTLQEAIYGRHRLEVRDAYSNEKLAEVTAFSGSIEIFK